VANILRSPTYQNARKKSIRHPQSLSPANEPEGAALQELQENKDNKQGKKKVEK